ncbi:MAG: succinyldiaminopimelate transaminase [Campylobacterota bacterium]
MQFEPYPFEKLGKLLQDVTPNEAYAPFNLTIGEPQFDTPAFIQDALKSSSDLLKKYPKTGGLDELRSAQRDFVQKRFGITLHEQQLIPTFGTREVLFNFPQFLLFDVQNPVMGYTNPFYQIYEGAAVASRAKSIYIKPGEFLDASQMQDLDFVILNYPNNPTALCADIDHLKQWVEYALKYDFVLLNDECYSEIYFDKPPVSLLEASVAAGNESFHNILVINSASKRSSAPGLRSGFIAGDESLLSAYGKYRTYVGAASPLPLQKAAIAAWSDEEHVKEFRKSYSQNFAIAKQLLGTSLPEATFYIWLHVGDELAFAKRLYKEYNVKVLPGSYLGRNGAGKGYVRLALVLEPAQMKQALQRVVDAL